MKLRTFLAIMTVALLLSACSSPSEKTSGKDMVNPVKATPESIASGKKLYEKFCMDCHGEKGDGLSAVAAAMPEGELKPPSIIDDQWDHGSTDGDIFVFIRDGSVGSAAMKGLNGRPGVGPTEMWNLVNYVRSLK